MTTLLWIAQIIVIIAALIAVTAIRLNKKLKTQTKIVLIAASVTIGAGLVYYTYHLTIQSGSGVFTAVYSLTEPLQDRMLVVDSKRSAGSRTTFGKEQYRVKMIRISNGEVTAGELIGKKLVFLGQAKNVLWFNCDEDIGLHARDGATLQTVINEKMLGGKDARLAQGINRAGFNKETQSVVVETKNGFRLSIGRSLAVSETSTLIENLNNEGKLSLAESAGLKNGDGIFLEGDLRKHLARMKPVVSKKSRSSAETDMEVPQFEAINPEVSFLDGKFLHDSRNGKAVEFENPSGVIVVHRNVIDSKARIFISRIALDGSTVWQIPLESLSDNKDEIKYACLHEQSLILICSGDGYDVLALNGADGKLLWKSEL